MTRSRNRTFAFLLGLLLLATGAARATTVTLAVELNGEPLEEFRLVKYYVYETEKREQYLAWGFADKPFRLPAGVYDLIVRYENDKAIVTQEQLEIEIPEEGAPAELELPFEFSADVASLNVFVTQGGVEIDPFTGKYTIYPVGRRSKPVASRRPGVPTTLLDGTYDVEVGFRGADGLKTVWLERYSLTDEHEETVSMGGRPGPRSIFPVLRDDPDSPEPGAATLRVLAPRSTPAGGSSATTSLLLVVDSSAEMRRTMDHRTRLEQATWAIKEGLLDLSGSGVRIGLRAFGITPRDRRDTQDSLLLVPVRLQDRLTLSRSLDLLRPSGMSPIGYALAQAESDLPEGGRNWIVLVVGSSDDASGDPCGAAARLLRGGIAERIDVVALDLGREQQRKLACIGEMHALNDREKLRSEVRKIFRRARRLGRGTVTLLDNGGGGPVAVGDLGDRLRASAGTYEVLIHADGETWLWKDVELSGEMQSRAGPQPRW